MPQESIAGPVNNKKDTA
uniref:Uncharacterized protein n=1 Tax=Anguilla anguilla TaxID=7936 RepID=A0A0E9PND6_ANGAN